jgi:U3 small nucleolar RNA-associated protein 22
MRHITPRGHLLHTHSLIQAVPSFRDALALLRVWANQRGYCSGKLKPGQGCILGFEDCGQLWVSLLSVLINGEQPVGDAPKKTMRRAVGKGLSSYQLFKAALSFLGTY